jgi:predicted DNA-binding transcriptional regulator AlpA
MAELMLIPRLIRLRDAPFYLGMDRNRFNEEVRPFVTEIRVGVQGVAFDRLELDAWAEQYKARNGRPGQPKGETIWDVKRYPDSSKEPVCGTSTSKSQGGAFVAALEQINL